VRRCVVGFIILLGVAGCARTSQAPGTDDPGPLPGPSTMKLSGTVKSAQFGVEGRLSAQVRSEAIGAKPLRSRYRGEMVLFLTRGAETLIDMNTVVEGEYDGSPTSGITQAINRFLDAVAATAPMERLKPATTKPSANSGHD
jgi:hypothetical protein